MIISFMKHPNRCNIGLVAVLATLLMVVVVVSQDGARAASLFGSTKAYFKNKLMGRLVESPLGAALKNSMQKAEQRFQEALSSSDLANMNEEDKSYLHQRLIFEELHKLRGAIASGRMNSGKIEREKSLEANLIQSCVDISDSVATQWDPDADTDDRETEDELMRNLREIDTEDEMGFALSPEARKALRTRANLVIRELMSNEVRQLALAALSAYMTGGTAGPVLTTLCGNIKYKLADFFVNAIVDIISAVMGRKIDIRPPGSEVLVTSQPPPSDAMDVDEDGTVMVGKVSA